MGEDGVSRVDLEASDPRVKRLLVSKGIDLGEFANDPEQTFILSKALCGPNTDVARYSVKQNVERILGGPWDETDRDGFYKCHRLRYCSMDRGDGTLEDGKHVHNGRIPGYTEEESTLYKDGIVLKYLEDGTLLINCFTVWSGYTWCERIYEIQVSDWTIQAYAYNAFGNGLRSVPAGDGLAESSLESYAVSVLEEREESWDWEGEPRADDVSYRIGYHANNASCIFIGSDGTRWAYNHQALH
jgi:hypothetical protein